MKKLIFAIALSFVLFGCETIERKDSNENTNVVTSAVLTVDSCDFNKEQYVWENFEFTTNKVLTTK